MLTNKQNNFSFFYFALLIFSSVHVYAAEMIIGEEEISPGINLIFEGAPKDTVHPMKYFRAESDTDIHIEMLANWSDEAPKGSPAGGFVAYLEVYAAIKGSGGNEIVVKLTPHLNMSDNLHYAQNIKLPGKIDELYDVTFTISPPKQDQLGIHYDWNGEVGPLVKETIFEYKNLDFKEIALSSRR